MPKANLTDRFIRSIKPTGKQQEFWDTIITGLALRVGSAGVKTFFLRYRFHKKRRWVTLGRYLKPGDLSQARKKAIAILGQLADGLDPAAPKTSADSFEELAADYMTNHAMVEKRSWKEDERIMNADLLPVFGPVAVDEIRPVEIRNLLHRIRDRGAPVMANRVHSLVRKVFAYGLEVGFGGLEFNPAAGIRRVAKEKPRARVLSDDDIRKVWQLWRDEASVLGCAFQLYLLTAQRRDELLTLPWDAVEEDRFHLSGDITKNGQDHTVYLSSEARKVFEQLRQLTGHSQWCFASPRYGGRDHITTVNNATRRHRRLLPEVENWSVHDLRRTAATILGSLEIPNSRIDQTFVVDLVLNHSPRKLSTQRYNLYTYEREVVASMESLGQHIASVVEPELSMERMAF